MRSKNVRRFLLIVIACLILCFAGISSAQVMTADITGTVSDSTGAVVAGAKVTVKSLETNITQTIQAGASGDYTFTLLPAGSYSITVEALGFKTFWRRA